MSYFVNTCISFKIPVSVTLQLCYSADEDFKKHTFYLYK